MNLDELLKPVAEGSPGGQDVRLAPIFDRIKEARRQDDELAQGVWQFERKLADYPLVIKLATEALGAQSKDLQIAAWLTEALLQKEGFAGLRDGLSLCRELLARFWDHLYPPLEDGDPEFRAAPLDWLSGRLTGPIGAVALSNGGYGLLAYQRSRTIGYEDQAKTKEQKAARDAALKSGQTAPEAFDKSVAETPKAFYAKTEADLDGCLDALAKLDAECREKFGAAAPSWSRMGAALEDVRHVVHGFLEKKREAEPDPVEPPPAPEPPVTAASTSSGAAAAAAPARVVYQPSAEPAGRDAAVANIAAAAQWLRRAEPHSPAPYLLLRGFRWGELRAAKDPLALEPPPDEIRRQVKALAVAGKWKELLEAAETAMALPCGRAWLDLQRLVVEACAALGREYDAIAIAIRSELGALLRDVPDLADAVLGDDTPAANAQTRAWLRELSAGPASAAPSPSLDAGPVPVWKRSFVDPQALAAEALRQGQSDKAIEILQKDFAGQRSGRSRFQRKLQLAQACVAAGKDAIAQPLIDDLAAELETHKLEDWEDREWIAAVLRFLLQSSKKIQADAKAKQAFFDRICRLDTVQALSI